MKHTPTNDDPTPLLRYRDSIYASDLLVCAIAWFDVFTVLKKGPLTLEDICASLGIQARPADVLISLMMAMGLMKKQAGRFGLTAISAKYLASDSPDALVPYYASLKNRPQCIEFRDVLTTGRPAGWSSKEDGDNWIKSMEDPAFADAFTAAMDSRGAFLADRLADILDLSRYRSLLDIAGGSGVYACAMARRFQGITPAILEIPPVAMATERSLAARNMGNRVDVITGDMFATLPASFDVHLFANTFHDWDTEAIQQLAANSFAALNPGGMVAVFDAHLNTAKDGPLPVAEYSCLLMHSTEGRCYSIQEIGDILEQTGFQQIRTFAVAAERSVITGKKE